MSEVSRTVAFEDSCATPGAFGHSTCTLDEVGPAHVQRCGGVLCKRRNLELAFSRSKAIQSAHAGGVLWLDLDHIDHRYLLAGGADGSVAAYDVQVVVTALHTSAASGLERGCSQPRMLTGADVRCGQQSSTKPACSSAADPQGIVHSRKRSTGRPQIQCLWRLVVPCRHWLVCDGLLRPRCQGEHTTVQFSTPADPANCYFELLAGAMMDNAAGSAFVRVAGLGRQPARCCR